MKYIMILKMCTFILLEASDTASLYIITYFMSTYITEIRAFGLESPYIAM